MKQTPKGPPAWAIAIAAAMVAGATLAWTPIAIEHAGKPLTGELAQVLSSLAPDLAIGAIAFPLLAWVMLLFLFRRRDLPRALAALLVLEAVSAAANVGAVAQAARQAAERQAAAAAEARAVVDNALKGLTDPADAALAREVLARLKTLPDLPQARRLRPVTVVHGPDDARAVCGQLSDTGELWTGFVARRPFADGELIVDAEHDRMSPATQAACEPLVRKYLGERKVDFAEADAAFAKAGCTKLDAAYWEARKRYCGRP